MKTIEEQREDLIKIIKKNNVEEFERYVKERDIVLKNLNNQGFDILIYTIENNISVDIIKSIIEQKQYKTYNYVINENSRQKVPLISAILNNNFEIADLLIKHNANINQFDIIYYLFKINRLNYQNLNYILYHGFHIRNITPYLINELIETNNNIILNKIFKYYLFSNEFILNFLKMYQDQNPVSLQHLQEVLRKEKKGIKVEGTMYDKALAKENYGAFKILFENDSGDEDNLLYKVNKYDLLEKAVKTNDINFVKTILRYDPFTFKSLSSKKILMAASRMKNINILKLLITMSLESYENEKALPSSLSSSSSSPSPSPSPSPSSSPSVKETNLKKNKYDVHYLNFIINIAIKMNDMNLVTFLMEDDEYKPYIDINTEDIHGEYPLITAFCYDHLDLFKYLISRGANCHIKSNGNTLLSMAIDDSDNTKYIKCLLKKKIDINEKDVNENYPLMKAIKKNNINIVILLVHYGLKHGVDMNVMDINGNTPLILSYRLEYYEIFKFLIKYLDINQRDSNGNSLLYYALLREDIETIEYLTGSGADVNIKFKSGGSALDLAISKGYRFIYALLHNKINIALNIPNEEGETPLISVIKSNDFTIEEKKRILQKLIKKGANVNFIDKEENTPLVYAIQMKSLPIIKLLIENGANINHLIKSSYITVLMEAIGLGEMDIVKYLVECNANINFKNEFGNTPLTYAISTNNDQMVKYLIDSGADVNNRNNQGTSRYPTNRFN